MPHRLIALLAVTATLLIPMQVDAAERPNIVWIIPDDMSPNFACYGEKAIKTPNVDRLAARGVRFYRAYVTAPVCSTSRSALITGMYQTSIGAHHHRSGRGEEKIYLPKHIKLVPRLFKDAGYYTTISSWPVEGNRKGRLGKTDYNFEWDRSVYDGNDWSKRKKGQPFFAQIHTPGGKLRGHDAAGWEKVSAAAERRLGSRTSAARVNLPPYYPKHPDILHDWAAYLDAVRLTDVMVGEVMDLLKKQGVYDNTLVVFMTDHGISHARGKQFLYDEGLYVPMIIAGAGIRGPVSRGDLVEHIDIAAVSLAAAGIKVPDYMHARNILAEDYEPRDVVFAARDRCDETVDHIRSVRTFRFKYIRNFLPDRPYLQPCKYKDGKKVLSALRSWHQQGKLNAAQSLIMRQIRPKEELYVYIHDRFELVNVAEDPKFAASLQRMRDHLDRWMKDTNDQGRQPESAKMYNSDMAVYLQTTERRQPDQVELLKKNIAQMKRWASEGK